jgi:hypothetical protein
VSPYDLNEYFISDFYPQVVPLTEILDDLRQTPMDWAFYKHVISNYPLTYIRVLFPSAGRSFGVIGGIREKVATYVKAAFPTETEKGQMLSFNVTEYKKERITSLSPSLMLRRLVGMRISCQGRHGFNGLKRLAFLRMLREAQETRDFRPNRAACRSHHWGAGQLRRVYPVPRVAGVCVTDILRFLGLLR